MKKKARVFFGSSSEGAVIMDDLCDLIVRNNNNWALLRPWTAIAQLGKPILKNLLESKDNVDFAVLVLTPDDQADVRDRYIWLPRDNVLFELGLFMGRLGPERVILLHAKDVKLPSDFDGYIVASYDPTDGEPAEFLLPAALKIAKHFQRIWQQQSDSNPRDITPPQPNIINKTKNKNKSSIIPIYCVRQSAPNWYAEFGNAIRQMVPSLRSDLLYFAPGGAGLWRQLSGGNSTAYRALKLAFLHNYQDEIGKFHLEAINLIDLGAGDFEKGRLILEYYIEQSDIKTINYFPLDVSYEMLSLGLTASDGAAKVFQSVLERGTVAGIHAKFSDLKLYNHMFSDRNPNIFLLLGNTLGNELSEEKTLADIRSGMNLGDILVTELQLIEAIPDTPEELTEKIQDAKDFYAGPFTALGCHLDDIELFVEQDDVTTRSLIATTYNVYCRLRKPTNIHHPLINPDVWVRDRKILVYVVRKYQEEAINALFTASGFEVLHEKSTPWKVKGDRRFHYITSRKV